MTSYAVPVQNTIKFSLAPSALATTTFKLSLKRRKIAKSFVRAARLASLVSSRGFAPLWKNSCGRPWSTSICVQTCGKSPPSQNIIWWKGRHVPGLTWRLPSPTWRLPSAAAPATRVLGETTHSSVLMCCWFCSPPPLSKTNPILSIVSYTDGLGEGVVLQWWACSWIIRRFSFNIIPRKTGSWLTDDLGALAAHWLKAFLFEGSRYVRPVVDKHAL